MSLCQPRAGGLFVTYRFLMDGVYNDRVEERAPSGCFTVDGQPQQGKYLRHTSRGSSCNIATNCPTASLAPAGRIDVLGV